MRPSRVPESREQTSGETFCQLASTPVVGGIVPDPDVTKLLDAGVAAVLTPGATANEVIATMQRVLG